MTKKEILEAERARKREEKLRQELDRIDALKEYERKYESEGYVCGIDEVGRGPLAGPVVACACILPKDCNILYSFAEKIGLAFQLQDDYLDCFGNEQTFGKRIGGDILCGKKTFMTVSAMQRMENEADRKAFLGILDATADTREAERTKIDRIIDIYRKRGIAEVANTRIQQFYDEAHRILLTLDADTTTLWNYATSLLGRES